MTVQEVSAIMLILETAYPAFYRQNTREEKAAALKLWAEMFADDDAALVAGAVKAFIATDRTGYPPTIGQIKGQIQTILEPEEDTAIDAWHAVHLAVRSGCLPRHFDALPPLAKEVIGSHAELKAMGQMSVEDFNSVGQANFLRSYRAREKNRRAYAALPSSVKALASAMAAKLALPESGEM